MTFLFKTDSIFKIHHEQQPHDIYRIKNKEKRSRSWLIIQSKIDEDANIGQQCCYHFQ